MTRLFVLVGFLSLFITSCGTPLCVGGVGDCGYDSDKNPKGPGSSTRTGSGPGASNGAGSDFNISAMAPNVNVNQTLQLARYKGTGKLTFKTTFPSEGFGQVDPQDLKYHAPDTITPAYQEVRIQATDSQNQVSNEIRIIVTQ